MPPKKNLEELVQALSDKMDALSEQQKERFDEIEEHFKELKTENASLKERVKLLEEENALVKSKLHDVELHSRSTSIRIYNYSPPNDDYNFEDLSDHLYNDILRPILQGAVGKGRLKTIPSRDRLIISAHPLRAKEGKQPPVICRLLNGFYRTIILQCQREFGVRATRSRESSGPPPLIHPIYEDCTSELYRFRQRLAAQDGIASAWIAGGVIRFKKVGSDEVRKVKSVFDTIESIIS